MKVSVIMPTANRPEMLEKAIAGFISQDWGDKELIIITSDFQIDLPIINISEIQPIINELYSSIGEKRNRACAISEGEIILHMDDDDVYSPDWITKSVNSLIESGSDLTGLSSCYYHDIYSHQKYFYKYKGSQPYILEATMCYWKKTWEKHPFTDTNEGEGLAFNLNAGKIIAHNHIDSFTAILHGGNTCSHKAKHLFIPVDTDNLNLSNDL